MPQLKVPSPRPGHLAGPLSTQLCSRSTWQARVSCAFAPAHRGSWGFLNNDAGFVFILGKENLLIDLFIKKQLKSNSIDCKRG